MIKSLLKEINLNQNEIVKTALYFDVFKYPLTKDELFENSAILISKAQFLIELDALIAAGIFKEEGGFILCLEQTKADLTKRILGNEGAKKIMPTALKYSKIIGSFPFVEGVCLSGGLSKNYYDKKSDIDFFIITKPNKLWICRSLLILAYKFLPKSRKKFWCTNYFISSDNLTIPDVNTFTGTELAYLIPTVNYSLYKELIEKNAWYKNNFPNKKISSESNCIQIKKNILLRVFEKLFSGSLGDYLDKILLKLTLMRWRKKYPSMGEEDFDLQFRSRKDVCKRHTHGFQNKVLGLWQAKTNEFEEKYHKKFSQEIS